MKRLLFALVFSVLALATSQRICQAQETAILEATGQIPEHFKTYTLFLVCNPNWLAPEENQNLYNLYMGFESFGRAIGDDNLAVWFWKSGERHSSVRPFASFVDVERSVRFCQAWKLKPTSGPHIVFLSTYPDENHLSSGLPKQSAVFALGAMKQSQISDLLGKLTDQLVLTGQVVSTAPADPQQLSPFVRLLQAVRQDINGFGCAWTFKVNAGPASADMHACQGG